MNTKNTILIIATLLIGIFVGMFISGRLTKQRINQQRERTEKPRMMAHEIAQSLSLSPEKEKKVDEIMSNHFEQMKQLRHELRDSSKVLRKEMIAELKTVLSDEEFKSVRKRFRAERKNQPKKNRKKRRGGNES